MTSVADTIIVAACLFLFIVINLDNLLRYHRSRSATSAKPEIEKTIATPLLLAGIGTVAFFLESFLYVLLPFWGGLRGFVSSLDIGAMQVALLESSGLLTMVVGYAIFNWSVLVRGQYATSWQMPKDHKLVNWGPYRYVRHPSYLAYFLMFIGFFLLWPNVLALIPMVAIPGYLLLTSREEEMLVARFGRKYVEYQKHVGRYLPKMSAARPEDNQ